MQSSRSVVAFLCASLLPPLAGAQQLAVPDTETHIGAQPLTRQPPIYPKAALAQAKEGWVMISYVISPEGTVVEPMIEDSSGDEAFEKAAIRAAQAWTYRPATQDGQPVEQAMVKTRIVFALQGGTDAASENFVRKYRRAARLINDGDLQAAEPLVAELEFGERDNLYEDAWFWWLKYVYLEATKSTDAEAKLQSLQRAVGYEQEYLTPDQFVAAGERLVVAHAQALDLSAAIAAFERLRDARTARRADNYEKTMASLTPAYEQMQQLVTGEQVLGTSAKIGEHDYWVHDLLRRSFALVAVNGRLDVLDIRCTRGTKRYNTIPPDAVWSIPQSWGDCGVYVKGEPGTTFSFREYPASYVATAPIDVSQPVDSP